MVMYSKEVHFDVASGTGLLESVVISLAETRSYGSEMSHGLRLSLFYRSKNKSIGKNQQFCNSVMQLVKVADSEGNEIHPETIV